MRCIFQVVQLLWNCGYKMMIKIGTFFFRYRNILFPLAFVLLFFENTWPIFHNEQAKLWEIIIGIAVSLSGQILRALTIGLVYIKRGGKKKQVYAEKLVQSGIFSHSRNPLYLGNFMILLGVGIVANSWLFILLGIPFFLFAYSAIILAEEDYLEKKFGQEFKDYCKQVNRIIPKFSGIGRTIQSMKFRWKRLIVKEYATPFIWITGTTFLIIKHTYLRQGSKSILLALSIFILIITSAFFIIWYLKKSKILKPD